MKASNENSAHGYTEGSEVPTDKAMHSEFEGHTPGRWSSGKTQGRVEVEPKIFFRISDPENDYKLIACVYDESNAKLIAAAPDLLKENQSLRSELQKQKELNAELVKAMEKMQIQVQRDCSIGSDPKYFDLLCVWQEFESLIKKSNPT